MGKLSEYVNQPKVEINGRKYVDEKLLLELLDDRIIEEQQKETHDQKSQIQKGLQIKASEADRRDHGRVT